MYRAIYLRGDYRRFRGDPGVFGFLKKTVVGAAKGFVTGGPVGAVTGGARAALGREAPRPSVQPTALPGGGVLAPPSTRITSIAPVRGLSGYVQRLVPGGKTGYEYTMAPRRRRMNVANPKALRRAIRRQAGFVKLARRALKGTGYTIVTRGARSRKAVHVRESGPGSVHVR